MVDGPAGASDQLPDETLNLEEVRRRLRRLIGNRIQVPFDHEEQAEFDRLALREAELLNRE
jgi:hypothetical protein